MEKGNLTLVIGNMFSGKTEYLIENIVPRLQVHAKKRVLVIKPTEDTRSGTRQIKAKPGKTRKEEKVMEAVDAATSNMGQIIALIESEERKLGQKFNVLAFDEVNFFPPLDFFKLVRQLLSDGYDVVAVGLEIDSKGEPFGPMVNLKLLAEEKNIIHLDHLTYCHVCGKPNARYPQRLVDGKPASYDSPQKLVGGAQTYQARCEDCLEIPDMPRITAG